MSDKQPRTVTRVDTGGDSWGRAWTPPGAHGDTYGDTSGHTGTRVDTTSDLEDPALPPALPKKWRRPRGAAPRLGTPWARSTIGRRTLATRLPIGQFRERGGALPAGLYKPAWAAAPLLSATAGAAELR